MESAPIALAYDHAKAASVATQSSDTTVAINEHALAAGEFAKAAKGTSSAEALRTLKLLEQHHQKLSELLRYPTENPPPSTSEAEVQAVAEKPLSTSAAVAELRASKSDLGPRPESPIRAPPSLSHPRRLPPRDMSASSSIASNLASARGIRANYTRQPLSPSVSTQQAPGSLESQPRRDKRTRVSTIPEHAQPSWVPPTHTSQRKVEASSSKEEPEAANDEGFSKFYSTFQNIFSKLPASLAFAGLPLVSEEAPASVPQPSTSSSRRPPSRNNKERTTADDPDLSKYFSRAALRASAREGHAGNDSFYVVPTTGHTVSYANILSFDQKEKRRLAASMHSEMPDAFGDPDDEIDDFVDAHEEPMPSTPRLSRHSSKKMDGKHLENRVEELDMENKSLKEVVDKLSRRLQTFEVAAQQNSRALVESVRLMRQMSPARGGEDDMNKRVLELEEHVQRGRAEIERLEKDNKRLRLVVDKYRERWEKLKEGAKMRREGSEAGKDAKEERSGKKDDPGAGRYLAG